MQNKDNRIMKGIYFKSENDVTSHFLINLEVKQENHNVQVNIYDIELPQEDLQNGDEVESYDDIIFCRIDLWNKYYFPTFSNAQNQWYYDYPGLGRECRMTAISDVMKFAVKIGLEKGNIELY